MVRIITSLIGLAAIGYGLYWYTSTKTPDFNVKGKIEELFNVGSFHTLEIRHSASQVMEVYRKDLLKDNRHRYLEPLLTFHPYLLLEVKYSTNDQKTREGVLLWDLNDGEMVIDTKSWEKTHGFGDCIEADTVRSEFKILNTLAKKGGSTDREGLSKTLHLENEVLDAWIDSCRKKGLIVQSGNRYRLHLENPKLSSSPQTKIDEWLVTKPYKNALRYPARYSVSQIIKIAKAAFGNDFTIRKTVDIFLPVHSIIVQNPDGSIHTSRWNALNGKQMDQTYSTE